MIAEVQYITMDLEQCLVSQIKILGEIHVKKMFGWMCIFLGRNFFGGYKKVDKSVLILFLILSPKKFEKAVHMGKFQKFEFGQTWVETELNSQEDVEEIHTYLLDALQYCQLRKKAKG